MARVDWLYPTGENGDVATAAMLGADHTVFSGTFKLSTTATPRPFPRSVASSTPSVVNFGKTVPSSTALAVTFMTFIPSNKSDTIFQIHVNSSRGSTPPVALILLADGRVQLDSTPKWTSSAPLPLGQWVRLSVYIYSNGSSLQAIVSWSLGNNPAPQETSGLMWCGTSKALGYLYFLGGSQTGAHRFGPWAYDTAATGPLCPFPINTPPILIGNKQTDALYFGNKPVAALYRGTTQLWP